MTVSAERKVLLDTSVIIEPPTEGVASFADLVSVSAVTVGELYYGVGASTDPVEQLCRRQRLQLVLDTYDVLPFDAEVVEFYGLVANMVRGGRAKSSAAQDGSLDRRHRRTTRVLPW